VSKLIEKIVNNKKIFAAVICFLIVIIIGCAAGIFFLVKNHSEDADSITEDTLIVSANFDEDENGFTTGAWLPGQSTFKHFKNGGRDDSGCVGITNVTANDSRYELTVPAEANSFYKISGWVKTEGVSEEGGAGANISVLGNFESYEYVFDGDDWKYIEFYGETAKGQAALTIALRLGFYSGENTGTAWFDDVSVYQVVSVPEGAVCLDFEDTLNKTDDAEAEESIALDENFYNDATKSVVIFSVFVFLAFLIAFRFARAYDGTGRKAALEHPCGEKMSAAKAVIAIFMIGLAIRIILALTPLQCSVDVNIFKYWGDQIVAGGFTETYNTLKDSIDYPPLYVYVLFIASSIKNLFAGTEIQGIVYSFLLKLTPIIADCVIGVIIYKMCNKTISAEWKAFIVAAWILNPVVIADSAVWGQVDSVLAMFVLLAVYCAQEKKFLFSGLWLGLGVMLKPQAIIVAPIIFFILLRYFIIEKHSWGQKFARLGFTVLGFIAGAVTPCLPFMFKMGPVETELLGKTLKLPWILSLFIGTANHYSYTSVNALNFWFLLGKNWIADSEKVANISLFSWGMAAIVMICIVIWVFFLMYKKKDYMPYVFAGVLYIFVAMFAPRMHERYFFPAVAFFAVAFVLSNNRIWLWVYTALSAFGFLTVIEVLLDLEVGGYLQDTGAEYDRYAHFLWVAETSYRNLIAVSMVLISVVSVVLAILFSVGVLGNRTRFERIWKQEDEEIEQLTLPTDDFAKRRKGGMSNAKRR